MTTEEKLDKAIEFIKSIEKLDASKFNGIKLSTLEADVCEECTDDYCYDIPVKATLPSEIDTNSIYVDSDILKDKAWHVLADLTV